MVKSKLHDFKNNEYKYEYKRSQMLLLFITAARQRNQASFLKYKLPREKAAQKGIKD